MRAKDSYLLHAFFVKLYKLDLIFFVIYITFVTAM